MEQRQALQRSARQPGRRHSARLPEQWRSAACRACLHPDRRGDHDDHPDHVRQDHVRRHRRDDQTESHLQQGVYPPQGEQPMALVPQREVLPPEASSLMAALQALGPASVQCQVLALRQVESLLRAVLMALPMVALLVAWGVRRPAELHRVHDDLRLAHGVQGDLQRARAVLDAQRAVLELQAQRSAPEGWRAAPEQRREVQAAWDAVAARQPEEEASGAAVRPLAAALREVLDVRRAEPRLVEAGQQGAPPEEVPQQAEPPLGEPPLGEPPLGEPLLGEPLLGEPWARPSEEPLAHLQAQQVLPARAQSAHRHSTHKRRLLQYAQHRASSWPAIRDEVLS